MPQLMEICLEDLDLPEQDERYLRCVALPGGQPGLALDGQGAVRWMSDDPAHCGLWVSGDERLALLRGADAGPIMVERSGRALEAPTGKPVILLDQDLLRIDGRRLRVHVHGETEVIHEPEPLSATALGRAARAAATALALGAAVGAGSAVEARPLGVESGAAIEVRSRPPVVARPRQKLDCSITAMKKRKGVPIEVSASCAKTGGLRKGMTGQIMDPKSKSKKMVKGGIVTITKVTKGGVVCDAKQLKAPVKATTLRFFVY